MDTMAPAVINNNKKVSVEYTQVEALQLVTLLRWQARATRASSGGVGLEIASGYERLAERLMGAAVGLERQAQDLERLPAQLSRIALLGGQVHDAGLAMMEARDQLAATEEFGHFAEVQFEDVRDLGAAIALMVHQLYEADETARRIAAGERMHLNS